MKKIARTAVVSALLCNVGHCSTLRGQIVSQNVSGCIRNSCNESEAAAQQRCEAACRNHYGQ